MTHNGLRPVELSIPITADFVPVFVFCANLYTSPRSIFIVITPAVVALHPPVATDCTMIRVVVVVHPTHTPLAHSVAVALLHSPVAADLDILSRLPFLVSGLLRLAGAALWLHRSQRWRVGGRRISHLLSLLELTATVDDKGHLLAVFHRLDGSAFAGRFDGSYLRIARGFQLSYELLLGQGMCS